MKIFKIFLFACLQSVLFACGGSYYYAKEYRFDCSTQQLLNALDSLKSVHPNYNVMYYRNGGDSLVNADRKNEETGLFFYSHFKLEVNSDTIFFCTAIPISHLKDTIDIKKMEQLDSYESSIFYGRLYFYAIFIGRPFNGHGKEINTKDLSPVENQYYIKLFEDSIVNKIKKRRFSYFL